MTRASALVRARAWRLRTEKVDFEASSGFPPAPPGPDAAEPGSFPDIGHEAGYHTAMEYRFVKGDFTELGPTTVQIQSPAAAPGAEEPTPAAAAGGHRELGNGVSATLKLEPIPLHRRPI